MRFAFAIAQSVGDRDNQEDFCGIQGGAKPTCAKDQRVTGGKIDHRLVAVLCDGMGGHDAGETAARTAGLRFLRSASALLQSQQSASDALVLACQDANQSIAERIERDDDLKGMGTTLVGLRCIENELSWVSVGDSHLLLLRGRNLVKLNQDHSMRPVLDQLVQQDVLTTEEAANHPQQNALRSALNGEPIAILDEGIDKLALRAGDLILMASDGIDRLNQALIANALRRFSWSLGHAAQWIVTEAIRRGRPNQDNTTVLLINVKQ